MATIHVDGKEYEVDGADNLLQACLSLGLDVPYFCWHPALGSVGACRQCAVKQYKDADDTRGRLVMSCMAPASDGAYISIEDEEAKAFRENVVEWLMSNHPHDCPVCEEGGNCHLQDMTVMTGHNSRRYRFAKRTHENQELGPFVSHEMNRCIACYRCTRYYKDYADGTDFGVYGANNNVYFGRPESGTLESEFAGNLVEVCPTGVFTDKTHTERYNRKWDMQFAPSICQQCSVGCNISPGERYGEVRRIENRYNGDVNHYFLCDRGRFGYGYTNLETRPKQPFTYQGEEQVTLNTEQAVQSASDIIKGSTRVIGIGSPRASLESNFALRKLVGADNFFTGIEAGEQQRLERMLQVLKTSGVYTPTLREIEKYDAVIILGEDITQTAARVALSVRQAVKGKAREMAAVQSVAEWQIAAIQNIGQHAKYPIFTTHTDRTRLDDVTAWHYSAPAADQARLGFAIAHAIDSSAPAVADLNDELQKKADFIASALKQSRKPLIISGSQAGEITLIDAAANIAKALKSQGVDEVGLTLVAREVNSMGLAMLGGKSLDEALSAISDGADTAIVLENDLYQRMSAQRVDQALDQLKHLIVVDHQYSATSKKAELVLSAGSFAEADGTVVNLEGRAQRFFQVYDPSYYKPGTLVFAAWRWLYLVNSAKNAHSSDAGTLDQLIAALASEMPQLAGIVGAAPNADFRIHGQKMARSPHRYSGRTAMRANISVHEPRQPQDQDSPFAFSMEGNNNPKADRNEVAFAWAPGWNSPQAWNKFQDEVGGHLRNGDPGVRLIETSNQGEYFAEIPASFVATEGQWQVAANYRLFGSDELSQRSAVIQERAGQQTVTIHPADAKTLGVNEHAMVSFAWGGQQWQLPLSFSDHISVGTIGLPLGTNGLPASLAGQMIDNLQEGHA
ncbi:NADH-quinone oxidoreductase subunit NuoG [Marinomonas spartinae]|uniref:NADH-quinone oxidoreductase subunit NuoG n=1 Tax=Marinomonas spartinae TaxID=1792290 RepID=UPI0018F1CB35|nr:NADH-quinone oxidoreductase subunit NuoG [Marinomonas spartinae]MBJ7553679.1 NADH-quinone oxidoreductase subunit NuoG [Marinomonas spartinae]